MQKFIKLTKYFYYLEHEDFRDRPVLGYLKGVNGSIMIDGGASIKHIKEFFDRLSENNLKKPDYCVLTHWHWDHIFGLTEINATLIAHENTMKIMKDMENTNWEETIKKLNYPIKNEFENGFFDIGIRLPDITYEKKMSIELENGQMIIEHVDADHTNDCCVIHIPGEKSVFFGDCLYAASTDDNLYYLHREIYLNLLNKLLSYEAEFYIDSHRGIFKYEDMKKMTEEFDELSTKSEKYDSKDDFNKKLSDTLKDSLSTEAIEWYYNCFRNGMKV